MINTLLIDFDGVIRHWTGAQITQAEKKLSVPAGSVLSVAFSNALLPPAITGKVTDKQWRDNVQKELAQQFDFDVASKLMNAWESATFDIDTVLLENIKAVFASGQIILATNATSRLDSDLAKLELTGFFSHIANAADIGFAKPNAEYYKAALAMAKCDASQCVYLDDSPINIEAAQRLGIKSELFTDSQSAVAFVKAAVLF